MAEDEEYFAYLKSLQQVQLPRWADLPQFDLYMDQVVQYVNELLAPLDLGELTATMVNNYVKKGVITPPTKKKYSRGQVANILIIAILKSVFSLDEIAAGIDYQLQGREKQQAFDAFIMNFAGALQQANTNFAGGVLISKVTKEDTIKVQSAMVSLAINAVLQKMLVSAMVTMVMPKPTGKKEK